VRLDGPDVERLLRGSGVETVATHFTQLATLNPVEFGDLALDTDLLNKLASLSGGRVVPPSQAASLADAFGARSKSVEERRESSLWDNWPLLVVFLGAVTAEWLVRRRSGLA
jgi:hypothetical protein